MKLYYGFKVYKDINKLKSRVYGKEVYPSLISSQSKIRPISWGNDGVIIEVPEENIISKFPVDICSPSYIDDKLLLFEFLYKFAGYDFFKDINKQLDILNISYPDLTFLLEMIYDEWIFCGSPKNKIIGVWEKKAFEDYYLVKETYFNGDKKEYEIKYIDPNEFLQIYSVSNTFSINIHLNFHKYTLDEFKLHSNNYTIHFHNKNPDEERIVELHGGIHFCTNDYKKLFNMFVLLCGLK